MLRNTTKGKLNEYVELKGGADSLLYFGKKNTSQIDIEIVFTSQQNHLNRFMLELESAQDSLRIKSANTAFYRANKNWEYNELESAQEVAKDISSIEVYHFHDTGDQSPMKGKCNIDDNHRLNRDGSNLAAFLYYLQEKHPKHFKRIEMTIRSIAPFFDRFDLKPSRLNEQYIQLEWKEKNYPDSYFNAYHLSDGTLRFICLATLLMQPNPPKTIIIDEPELGLHPVAVNKLASLIRKISSKSQVIISTQSINLIDNFDPENIIVTDRKDNSSIFRRLNSKELESWLEEYTLGDIWGKNLFGAQPYSF